MNKFEAVVLFNPDLSNPVLQSEEDNFNSIIEKLEGKISASEEWGLRDLSYNIEKYKKAFYKYYQIEINGSKVFHLLKKI